MRISKGYARAGVKIMKVQPLRDNVLIQVEKKEEKEKTDSGIYLPETAASNDEKPQIGKVIAIGESEDIRVKKGDSVIFSRYAGTDVEIEGVTHLVVKNEDILAIVE